MWDESIEVCATSDLNVAYCLSTAIPLGAGDSEAAQASRDSESSVDRGR
jgi:hypothetical protein